jgi:hypothetical protein
LRPFLLTPHPFLEPAWSDRRALLAHHQPNLLFQLSHTPLHFDRDIDPSTHTHTFAQTLGTAFAMTAAAGLATSIGAATVFLPNFDDKVRRVIRG